jgi:acyl-CoA synthetase (AMP-forming)/AMP-acid ligase II
VELPVHGTLIEMLAAQAEARGSHVALTFVDEPWTFARLWNASRHQAGRLVEAGISRGDRVVIAAPNGPGFLASFFGVQLAGAVPVPVIPSSGNGRIRDLAMLCKAAALVLPAERLEGLAHTRDAATHLRLLEAAAEPEPPRDPGHLLEPRLEARRPDEDDVALIQYTSGSTGDPKGVIITHRMVMTNIRQMVQGMEITPADIFVSWLPVHHDMGLVLMTLTPLCLAASLVLLPTDLASVRPWLEAISRHRGTFTAAPDIAYRLSLRAVRDPSRLDLASLRVALNAAEPVRASTIERFERHFSLERVMVAGYGLAEATVGVAMGRPGSAPVLGEHGLVAIGRPFPGITLEVVDDTGARALDQPGELLVSSPAATPGYLDNPEATRELRRHPGRIRTGDLAVERTDGQVFVVGRLKSTIIQAGRTLAPSELEETVEALPFVRRAAAVGIDRGRDEGEQAHVLMELRRATPPPAETLREMAIQAVSRIHERLGLRPGRVWLLRPRTIPLTANGKIRHAELRTRLVDGSLRADGAVLYPGSPTQVP